MFGFVFNVGQKYIDTPIQYKTQLNNIFDNPWTNPEMLSMFNIMFCSFLTQIINLKPQIINSTAGITLGTLIIYSYLSSLWHLLASVVLGI